MWKRIEEKGKKMVLVDYEDYTHLEEENKKLRKALRESAIRHTTSPNGRWAGYMCELCGSCGDEDRYGVDIKHKEDCLLTREDNG